MTVVILFYLIDKSEYVAPFSFYSFSGTLAEAPQALKCLICHLRKLRKH